MIDDAALKRARRAKALRAAVLAGGWGLGPQAAAWDAVWPDWRDVLSRIVDHRRGGDHGWDWKPFSAALNADRRWLARRWSRLLRQEQGRSWDQAFAGTTCAGMGGYPIR